MAEEVAARVCAVVLKRLEAEGLAREPLLRGLDIGEEALRGARARISWDAFARLLDRVQARIGGPEALERFGAAHATTPVAPAFPAVTRMLLRPRDIYWVSGRWYGQTLFRNIGCELEDLPDGRILETLTIPAADADSPAFFHLVLGVIRSAPRFLGLPDAHAEMEVAPRCARYRIRVPASLTPLERLRRRFVFSPGAARRIIRELSSQHDELRSAWGELAAANASLRAEIEQRRRAEGQLRQAQKLEAVGRLAAGVAHDFNNLLTAISGYSDLVLKRLAPADASRADVLDIRGAAERATDLTTKLLAFSRAQSLKPEPLDPNQVVGGMEGLVRSLHGAEIEICLRLSPAVGRVLADRTQLEQVVLNLCLNARDAMPTRGVLSVETCEEEHAAPHSCTTGFCPPGRCVVLAVEDTGCGMDARTREHAFEPFFTTKGPDEGSGLGLSTVYGIVRQSGGQIQLRSEPGRGTRVEVHLPRTEERPAPAPPVRAGGGTARGDESILLVEDDEAVRRLARSVLEEAGYRVVDSPPGSTAMEIALGAAPRIDLLVTDVRMPRVSGPELALCLRSARGAVPVLYISGYPEAGLAASLGAGTDLLKKPFSAAALTERVRTLLDAPPPG